MFPVKYLFLNDLNTILAVSRAVHAQWVEILCDGTLLAGKRGRLDVTNSRSSPRREEIISENFICNSLVLKYFTNNSFKLKDLAGTTPKSLIPQDRTKGG